MEQFLENFDMVQSNDKIKSIIESLLFTIGDPVSLKELSSLVEVNEKRLKVILEDMIEEYKSEKRGIQIIEFNNKVQLSTKPENCDYIKRLIKPDNRQNLSHAALETLAIIAYKQPITKVEIEEIRGVRSDRAVSTLLERGLVREGGRMDTPGRPILYCSSDEFLKYFGFKNLKELPELIEFNLDDEERI